MPPFGGGSARPPQDPQQSDREEAWSAAAHDLSESLSAIAAYVETAHRLLVGQTAPPDDTIVGILGKASAQTDRAVEAFRHLRALIRPAKDDHGTDGRELQASAAEPDNAAEGLPTRRDLS